MAHTRRDALRTLGAAGAGLLLRVDADAQGKPLTIGGQSVELRLASISPNTIRFSIVPAGKTDLNSDRALVPLTETRRAYAPGKPIRAGAMSVQVDLPPEGGSRLRVMDAAGALVQEITVDAAGVVQFLTGDAPLLGFGEGGAQF